MSDARTTSCPGGLEAQSPRDERRCGRSVRRGGKRIAGAHKAPQASRKGQRTPRSPWTQKMLDERLLAAGPSESTSLMARHDPPRANQGISSMTQSPSRFCPFGQLLSLWATSATALKRPPSQPACGRVLVGLLTPEQIATPAFSSTLQSSATAQHDNGKDGAGFLGGVCHTARKGRNRLDFGDLSRCRTNATRSVTAAGPSRNYTGVPCSAAWPAAKPHTNTRQRGTIAKRPPACQIATPCG